MKICIAGATGAFGTKHLDAVAAIEGVDVISVVDVVEDRLQEVAENRGIAHWTTDLAESLARSDVEAVILATPTQLHTEQAIQCLEAGKHVLVEIPMADTLA
ncbi:MAG: Gfo/Idh/MocA family oxidoreductase, partial [Rhodospirillaceae bacterium]|nr:Gfo/Idh/MocA family oxidoreductase [Rhodospirillaceae bacterium]